MPTYRPLNDRYCIDVIGSVSDRVSRIILPGTQAPVDDPGRPRRTHVSVGILRAAGPGRAALNTGIRVPNLLTCEGFEIGCRVFFVTPFTVTASDQLRIVHQVDILAAEGADGEVFPAWSRVLLDSPRTGGVRKQGVLHIVEEERTQAEQPLAVGTVLRAAPRIVCKVASNGTVLEYNGEVSPPLVRPGQRALFKRYAAWRFFGQATTDDRLLVMCDDVLTTVSLDAELDLCRR